MAPDLEKLHGEMRTALEAQLEAHLVQAALEHDTINRLPGDRDVWENSGKEPTHCLWHPSGEAGYAVPIRELKMLMGMRTGEMIAYLETWYPVIIPKQSKGA